jgi:hypothetical protein
MSLFYKVLPDDVLKNTLKFLTIEELGMFCRVSTHSNNLVKSFVDVDDRERGPIIQWLRTKSLVLFERMVIMAASENNIEVLSYLLQRNGFMENQCHEVGIIACYHGHIKVLDWITTQIIHCHGLGYCHEHQRVTFKITPCVCWIKEAVKEDQVDVLKWIYEKESLRDRFNLEIMVENVILYQSAGCLEWFIQVMTEENVNFTPSSELLAGNCTPRMLKLVKDAHWVDLDHNFLKLCAYTGNVRLFKWLFRRMRVPNTDYGDLEEDYGDSVLSWVKSNNYYMVRYCIQRGFSCDERCLLTSIRDRHYSMATYIWKNTDALITSGSLYILLSYGKTRLATRLTRNQPWVSMGRRRVGIWCEVGNLKALKWWWRYGQRYRGRQRLLISYLHSARMNGHRKVEKWLRSKGCQS